MSVKLPATLNIQPEYAFFTWENAQSLWVPLFCYQVITLWRRSVLQLRLLGVPGVPISSPVGWEFVPTTSRSDRPSKSRGHNSGPQATR